MDVLTVEKLKAMQPGEIFARGTAINSPDGVYMTSENYGDELKWIAKRGDGFYDWAIYCFWSDKSEDWIRRHGQKVSDPKNIKRLVPCDDGAFNLYRK